MKKPELMSGVGNFVTLHAAIDGGADAVYLGLKEFTMRANAKNFSLNEVKKVIELCHNKKVKVYVTLNTIIYDKEIKKIENIIKKLKDADGVIFWDLSVLELLKKYKIKPILSTQASVSNFESAKFYYELGVKRIVLARELSLEQIKEIIKKIKKEKLDLEIECFIHGAMCVSVSGRCFSSQFLFNRSANRGDCLQPCRREYIIKDKDEGYELELDNNFVMSAKDLCCLPFIDKLIKIGVNAFKIEGRNRDARYVAVTTKIYRKAIDGKADKDDLKELEKVYNRGFSSGFYFNVPGKDEFVNLYGSLAKEKKVYVGRVVNYFAKVGVAEIKTENSFKINERMVIEGDTTGCVEFLAESFHDNRKIANKGEIVGVKSPKVRKRDKVYVIRT